MSLLTSCILFLQFSKPNVDKSWQAVAPIIQNSAVRNVSPKTEGPKTKSDRVIVCFFWMKNSKRNFDSILQALLRFEQWQERLAETRA